MQEHNLFADLLGCITLPFMVFVALGAMAGAKPDSIAKPFFSVVAVIIQGLFQVLTLSLKVLFKAMGEIFKASSKAAVQMHREAQAGAPKPSTIKIKIVEEGHPHA